MSNQRSNIRYNMHHDLSDLEAVQLRFLKQEVNRCTDEFYREGTVNGSQQRLWYARENLKNYVNKLRSLGKRV